MKNSVTDIQNVILEGVMKQELKALKYSVFLNFLKNIILDYDDFLISGFQL